MILYNTLKLSGNQWCTSFPDRPSGPPTPHGPGVTSPENPKAHPGATCKVPGTTAPEVE